MAGFRGLGSVFQRRRKKNGSSRRWAIRSKQPLRTSVVTPTAPGPDPNNRIKEDIIEEASVQDTIKQLSPTLNIGALFFAVRSVMQKCRNTISNTCSGFLNVIVFWGGYAERVESLHRKVEELQMEIALLHSTLKLSQEAKPACGTLEIPDGAHHALPPPPPPPVSLTPPPPPPPPPPPIPPTFAVPKVPLFAKRTAQPPTPKKNEGPVAVTLRDLQTVQLRKVTVTNKTPMISPDKRRTALVTLADLQKVRLRRSHSDVSVRFRSSLGRSPTKGSMNLRVPLRKINICRSPGGTPLCNKENEGLDSSLEFSITKALGNKHLCAITKGISPLKSV